MKNPIDIEELQKNCYWTTEDEADQFDGVFKICSVVDGSTLLKVDLREQFIGYANFIVKRILKDVEELSKKREAANAGDGVDKEMVELIEKQYSHEISNR